MLKSFKISQFRALNHCISIICLILGFSIISSAQNGINKTSDNAIFVFRDSSGTFEFLDSTKALSANNGIKWDAPEFLVPIGFEFSYGGRIYDTIVASDHLIFDPDDFILTFYRDLIDRGSGDTSLSPISYITEGTPGSRIFKIEWKNFGFYCELIQVGTLDFYGNFQVWLYEGSNNIEMHIGPSWIDDYEDTYCKQDGAFYGLTYNNVAGNHQDYFFLTGDTTNVTTTQVNDQHLTGTPRSGRIFRFEALPVSIGDDITPGAQRIKAFPNPSNGSFTIDLSDIDSRRGTLFIKDVQGRIISNMEVVGTNRKVSVNHQNTLSPGTYFLEYLNLDNKVHYGKISVQ